MDQKLQNKLSISLLSLRITVFIVFFFWGLDKIIVPEHAVKVMSGFYGLNMSTNVMVALGVGQMLFLAAFLLGMWKKVTYGAVLVLHGASTLSSFAKYFDPFNNLLFFAAWPMLAACLVLFLLRDYDVYTIGKSR
ncbi:hypothetical protein A9264_13565 [Vibrio sp. UCD-FRSSP16_10]|uniref:hypothetical protein n=1 Tax=unclassified Vibrio TaxID=2614977 RepID=UPI0007FFF257|nr:MULTISPECIES: hypothetical protein [unclassified Vibrio]OBT14799.1 hypothetical protein A9260_13780 [Vibrio sp. UCD-FRSSP16_30]OBT20088.1 hypothetical protein A9264_13565 [Vibrio sp. UCD-FRSSP16_10]